MLSVKKDMKMEMWNPTWIFLRWYENFDSQFHSKYTYTKQYIYKVKVTQGIVPVAPFTNMV